MIFWDYLRGLCTLFNIYSVISSKINDTMMFPTMEALLRVKWGAALEIDGPFMVRLKALYINMMEH